MGKKPNLKAALSSQQSRLKQNKKEKAREAALIAEKQGQKKSKTKLGTNEARKVQEMRVTIPFQPTDNILLIGEGNFSFARALVSFTSSSSSDSVPSESSSSAPASKASHVLAHLPPENVIATAYDSEEECFAKYTEARDIVSELRKRNVEVLFEVDGTQLEKCKALRGRKFDRVVWNFPHAGKGITDQDRNIHINQTVLLGFLRSVAPFLKTGPEPRIQGSAKSGHESSSMDVDISDDDADITQPISISAAARGTLLITLRNVEPYRSWDLPALAKRPPASSPAFKNNPVYKQLRSFQFWRDAYPGYEHRMTKGERARGKGTTGVGGEDRTWEFCLRDRN